MKTIRYLAGLVLCLLTFTACGKDPERGGRQSRASSDDPSLHGRTRLVVSLPDR